MTPYIFKIVAVL